MEAKIIKPQTCEKCEVVRFLKGSIQCWCLPDLKASTPQEKIKMWKNCPLQWDEEDL